MTLQLETARAALAEEWQRLNPRSEEEISAFYRHTTNYRADLDAWHELPERQLWTQAVVAAARTIGAKRILDVGAGAGHDLKALKADNSDYQLSAVEPNDEMRAELWRNKITPYESIGFAPTSKYDMIMCLDVLEHVPNPDSLLYGINARLDIGGIFVEATAVHDTDTPLHLVSLRGWSPARYLDSQGFLVIEEIGRLRIWQKISDSRQAANNILMCAYRSMSAETVEALVNLAQAGWRRSIHRGDALVSRVRSVAVSKWMQEDDGDVFLMVDDDIVFTPKDAEKIVQLARSTRSIASAAYPVRGGSHLASRLLSHDVVFGPTCPPIEIKWAGTGFFAVHRDVCEAIVEQLDIPLCTLDGSMFFWPMFMPFVYNNTETGVHEYLSEDWAFCERARKLGFKVWMDPSIELTHLGQMPFTVRTMMGAAPEPAPTDGGL